ncbi:MAG: GspH/FimT family pseudopilin [Phycisphaeraceae bacterium]|nr:GspH/FimT family pseudopilin [Phycisphaeraceae bacterium]
MRSNLFGSIGPSARSAFTLLELLIVVTVMGIAGALVIPSMNQVGALRGQTAIRTAVADITFAQSEALAHQRRYVIVFGKIVTDDGSGGWQVDNGNGYTVCVPPVGNAAVDVATDFAWDTLDGNVPFSRDFDLDRYHGANITGYAFNNPTDTIIFDELGGIAYDLTTDTPGQGGALNFDTPVATYDINLEAYTGRVTVVRTEK